MAENFHFIQPLWLLALLPLLALLWRLARPGGADNPWSRIVDAPLLPLLMTGRPGAAGRGALWLLAAGWSVAVLALADPTWERQPRPVYQTTAARVIVLDLSRSMNAPDLSPSRLARARYKVEDILRRAGEGQTGLVVFAGDAFTVAPLTRDANTIRALLKAVDTSIMPVQGSRADLGLKKADELLRQAGLGNGDVLLIADGVDRGDASTAQRAAAQLKDNGYRVSVLGVGTEAGAPIPGPDGGLLRDATGKVVMPGLETANLQAVARAGGGAYRQISAGNDDVDALVADRGLLRVEATQQSELKTDRWKESGPLLAVLLLPLAALAFRRGWLLGIVVLAGVLAPPPPAFASTWDDLWLRPEQQAARALSSGDYTRAAQLATDPARRGSAEYKRGNFEQALAGFAQAGGADADYDRGNALAKLGRYQDAVAAYDQALKAKPDMDDARANKAAVEALLKKQPQQNPRQDGGKNGDASSQKTEQAQKPSASGGKGNQQDSASAKGSQPQNGPPAGKGSDSGAQSGHDQQAAKSDQGNAQPAAKDAASGQRNPAENQFSQAAKALDAKRADAAKKDESTAAVKNEESAHAASGVAQAPGGQAAATATTNPRQKNAAAGVAEALNSDERLAADQWLRRIPDDPGGLLRRKFQYQYKQREQRADTGSKQSW